MAIINPEMPKDKYIVFCQIVSHGTKINTNTNLNIENATIGNNVYGGGNEGEVTENTFVHVKNSILSESLYAGGNGATAIVYGNRYRPLNTEVDIGLMKAEKLFFQGSYKKALEQAIHSINIIEPGIYKKLMDEYQS